MLSKETSEAAQSYSSDAIFLVTKLSYFPYIKDTGKREMYQ
jgi:hypothetical protein